MEGMKRMATLINERKRKLESIEKIAQWQAAVDEWEVIANILHRNSPYFHRLIVGILAI